MKDSKVDDRVHSLILYIEGIKIITRYYRFFFFFFLLFNPLF